MQGEELLQVVHDAFGVGVVDVELVEEALREVGRLDELAAVAAAAAAAAAARQDLQLGQSDQLVQRVLNCRAG